MAILCCAAKNSLRGTVFVHILASNLCGGTASTHLVDLPMVVSKYTWPSEVHMHVGICVLGPEWHGMELPAGCGHFPAGPAASPGTWLPRFNPHPSRRHAATIHLVARMPGWATLWMAWKTAALSATNTSDLVMPCATSQSRLAPLP
jgi:hypothetical protein